MPVYLGYRCESPAFQDEGPSISNIVGDLKLLLKLMKHAYHLGSAYPVTDDFRSHLKGSKFTLVEPEGAFLSRFPAMIPSCSFAGNEDHDDDGEGCDLFQPSLTDGGICHVFNDVPISRLVVETPYVAAFREAFLSNRSTSNERGTMSANGGGLVEGLSFYVDRRTMFQGGTHPK